MEAERSVIAPGSSPAPRVDGDLVARVAETVAWVEVDGEAVLYDELRQVVHVLNQTAALVLSGIDGRTSLGRIARDLSEAFGTDLDVVRADVLDLADDLMQKGLITPIASPDDPARSRPRTSRIGSSRSDEPPGTPRFLDEPPSG